MQSCSNIFLELLEVAHVGMMGTLVSRQRAGLMHLYRLLYNIFLYSE